MNVRLPAVAAAAWGMALLGGCSTASAPAPSLFEDDPTEAAPTPSPLGPLRFDDVGAAWGLQPQHHAGRSAAKWMPEIMSGGVALLDVDRDGALDVLFADAGALLGAPPEGAGPRLFLGDGRGGFTDATKAWGLRPGGYGMGVAAGDIDGDGWTDVYLTTWNGSDRLLRNDGGTRFVDVTEAWGAGGPGWSTSAAFLDIDGDGDLDLYVVRYVDYALQSAIKCWFRTIHIYCTPAMYSALPDRLLRNEGDHFVDVSAESGVATHVAKGLAVGTGDVDDDGDVDLYVADDITRNLLLLNDGTGHFEERGTLAGVAYSELGREEASMGVSMADANADGRWDLAVTNFQAEPTSLYVAKAAHSFREQADRAGIGASSRARLSFGIEFLDADNDGDEDLLTANGHVADNVASFRDGVTFEQPSSLYLNEGEGRFVDVSAGGGSAITKRGVSRGLAVGDLDSDGGLDFVIVENDAPLLVGANRGERGHWVSLWLEGGPSNRSAIGATITAQVGDRTLRREVRGASSYLSVSDRRVHFGLGASTRIDRLVVRWPDGTEQTASAVGADRHLRWVQGAEPAEYTPGAGVIAP
jgi:hypothetical protein